MRHLRFGLAVLLALAVSIAGPNPARAQSADELDALNTQVNQLYQAGKFSEATPIAQQALALAERLNGPDHPTVVVTLGNLAVLHLLQGRYAEAEPLYKRSVGNPRKGGRDRGPRPGRPCSTTSAEVYRLQGRYAEAEPLYRRSLAIAEKAQGPDGPDAATPLNNLGLLYQAQRRYAEAEPLHKRSVTILEKALGPDHPSVATMLNNLAELYRTQGRYAEAEPLYKRSLAISEKALGSENPSLAGMLNAFAELYRLQGRYAEAEQLYKRSLALTEKALGPDHPGMARRAQQPRPALSSAGPIRGGRAALQAQRRPRREGARARPPSTRKHAQQPRRGLSRARPVRRGRAALQALARHQGEGAGPDSPDAATPLNNLGLLYQAQGRHAEAEPLHKRSVSILEKALGPDHPSVGNHAQQPRRALSRAGPLCRGRAPLQALARHRREGAGARPPRVSDCRSTTLHSSNICKAGTPRRSRSTSAPSPSSKRPGARSPECWATAQQPGGAL